MRHVVSLWLVFAWACALEVPEASPRVSGREAALRLPSGWFAANEGIDGADVRSIALHPSGVLYAGALGGRVYRRAPRGLRFLPADTGLPAGFVHDVAVDPRDAEVVYVALSQSGLYKSDDGGESYALTGLRREVYGVEVAPSDSNVVYARTPQLERSDDGGVTFSPSLASPAVSVLAISQHDPHTLYVMDEQARVHRSDDGGTSFVALRGGLPLSLGYGSSTLALDPSHEGVIYAGVSGAGLYRSEDHGASFLPVAEDLRAGQSYDHIAVDPQDENVLYVAASVYPRTGGLFRSRDRGQSFEAASYRESPQDIALDPSRTGHVVLAVGEQGVAFSQDGLESHVTSSWGMHDVSVAHVAFDASLFNVAYAATRRGLYVTWTLGAGWQRAPIATTQYTSVKADATRPGTAYVGSTIGPDGEPPAKLFRTTNAGLTFQDLTYALPGAASSIEPLAVHGATLYVRVYDTLSGSLLLRSQNGGQSFQRLSPAGAVVELVTRSARDALLVTYGELWHTSDAGDSWRSVGPPGMSVSDAAVVPGQPNVIYASSGLASGPTAQLGLRRSDDGGLTWRAPSGQFSNRAVAQLAVSPVDGRIWLSTTEAGPSTAIYVSTNGGVDFVAAGAGLESELIGQLTPHPRLRCVAFAATSTQAVFETLDAGGTCR